MKLRPSAALAAAESRAGLRPLHERPSTAFALGDAPDWFLADLPEGASSPWDLAHERVADQLGVAGSDVVFVEPDVLHDVYLTEMEERLFGPFEIGADCGPGQQKKQDPGGGRATGPDRFAWHLDDEYSQLARARSDVSFTDPRTRIAHLDTGYYAGHVTTPARLRRDLERNVVDRDGAPRSAEDPDNRVFPLDNSGHGTGTIGILAGAAATTYDSEPLGGAPDADVVPIRIADSVVLLYTSAFAQGLRAAVDAGCDVVTMSMGGLPARAWREEVERAYQAGVCIVSAAGNNFGNVPTRHIVYPARYGCVIAACGVMADRRPYHGLTTMQGNFGPRSVMGTALSAYTPNIPWPVFGCESMIRLDGSGTSAATPQIAAAAALWLERYKAELPRDWRRVEAVFHALFTSAKDPGKHREQLGNGMLQAAAALAVRPRLGLPRRKAGGDSFAFLRVLTGLGLVDAPPREEMFNLEVAQRWLLNPALQGLVPDPDAAEPPDDDTLTRVIEALIEDDGASQALRTHLQARYPVVVGNRGEPSAPRPVLGPPVPPACDPPPALGVPPHRRLRVYAVDPDLSGRLATAAINEVALAVRWEDLSDEDGPVPGEYLEIDDVDASGHRYDTVDLDDPRLLAQDGWAPSEGNGHFHQQMVYAVAMKTIEHFERALGRPVLWRPRPKPDDPADDGAYVGRLTVRPHGVRQANAFYSPTDVALLFGYFEAESGDPSELVPGSRVYTCLSYDVVAHETTHAILDGMFRRFAEPSNPDVLAFHEGLADLVALLQRFTIPQLLENEIQRTRGNIEAESLLGSLATQLGRATGGRAALRDAIGTMHDGAWARREPDPLELDRRVAPHTRGAILVAAVFDAFIAIYKTRTADLLRIATGGTGALPTGALHPDLVRRLAGEAAASAGHVLTMCIRALDYLPPVDLTFFEYLRALITADFDLVRDDRYNYRVAFVESFRRWGIHPLGTATPAEAPRTFSVDTLRWRGIDLAAPSTEDEEAIRTATGEIVAELKRYADLSFHLDDREARFHITRDHRRVLHGHLAAAFRAAPALATALGLDAGEPFEVHELRPAMRVAPSGRHTPQVVVALTQSTRIAEDTDTGTPAHTFRGGTTLVVDLAVPEITYAVFKRLASDDRHRRTAAFLAHLARDPLRNLLLSPAGREPFAALHILADGGL
ncbi:MAG TPA: S8 family serine peptidase [Egibacteraceae bacterium]|nr:S8 family serine peptidase [Egibacteraceae bacterium]